MSYSGVYDFSYHHIKYYEIANITGHSVASLFVTISSFIILSQVLQDCQYYWIVRLSIASVLVTIYLFIILSQVLRDCQYYWISRPSIASVLVTIFSLIIFSQVL